MAEPDTDRISEWMSRALALAERGKGAVEPNPLVGAVVVRDDRVVGEGWHARFGGPHAEVAALDAAKDQARGATLIVTLEPCCHHGKTPPCVDRIIEAGIARVIAAMADPFPQVAGQGGQRLAAAGVDYRVGYLEPESRRLNAPYLKLLASGTPYVRAKWAMTLDGKIATAAGESKWITGPAARAAAHVFRGTVDGILVGVGTVLADDPLLTARPAGPRIATRVVLDSLGRTPAECQLVATARDFPTLITATERAPRANLAALEALGCECLVLPADPAGRVPLEPLLRELGARRWTNLLVEGGAEVLGSFLDARQLDAATVYLAPKLFGGRGALAPIGGVGVGCLADALALPRVSVTTLDGDIAIDARRDDR